MLTALRIEGYRGIRQADIGHLGALNVFVGPNGTGKTAILEAIFLVVSESHLAIHSVLDSHAELDAVRWLFYRGTRENPRFTIAAELPASENYDPGLRFECEAHQGFQELEVTTGSPRGSHTEQFTVSDHRREVRLLPSAKLIRPLKNELELPQLYTRAVQAGHRKDVFDLLQRLVPQAQALEILTSEQGSPELNVIYGDYAAPVTTLGDGLVSLVRQSLELSSGEKSVLCLEEPETFKHPGAIRTMASAIVAACGRGRQIFLATHSLELIDALLSKSPEDSLSQLRVFRLRLNQGDLIHSTLTGLEARELRTQIEEDLR